MITALTAILIGQVYWHEPAQPTATARAYWPVKLVSGQVCSNCGQSGHSNCNRTLAEISSVVSEPLARSQHVRRGVTNRVLQAPVTSLPPAKFDRVGTNGVTMRYVIQGFGSANNFPPAGRTFVAPNG